MAGFNLLAERLALNFATTRIRMLTKVSFSAAVTGFLAVVTSTCLHAQLDTEFGDASIDELRNARDVLVEISDFSAALEPARTIVAEMERLHDANLGSDLLRLARIQAGLQEFNSAEESYLRAIEIVGGVSGRESSLLIGAYHGLGRNYINDRRFDEALVALDQARNLSRQTSGLFNVEQSMIIDDLTFANLGVGDTLAARDLQLDRLDNALRRFGADDPRTIPFHAHLGDYFDNSRLRISAREQFARALEVSEESYGRGGAENLALLERLTAIDLQLDHDSDLPQRITEVLDESPDISPKERAPALALLGDWALVHEDLATAVPYYTEAYRLLNLDDSMDADEFFSIPRPLNLVLPLSAVDSGERRDPWTWGEIELKFTVSADGRASNVRTATIKPGIRGLSGQYIDRIREAYFRPRLDKGLPSTTENTTYRHDFRYYVRD
jgi:tetratricopeptide (TPR) repeat protein